MECGDCSLTQVRVVLLRMERPTVQFGLLLLISSLATDYTALHEQVMLTTFSIHQSCVEKRQSHNCLQTKCKEHFAQTLSKYTHICS